MATMTIPVIHTATIITQGNDCNKTFLETPIFNSTITRASSSPIYISGKYSIEFDKERTEDTTQACSCCISEKRRKNERNRIRRRSSDPMMKSTNLLKSNDNNVLNPINKTIKLKVEASPHFKEVLYDMR